MSGNMIREHFGVTSDSEITSAPSDHCEESISEESRNELDAALVDDYSLDMVPSHGVPITTGLADENAAITSEGEVKRTAVVQLMELRCRDSMLRSAFNTGDGKPVVECNVDTLLRVKSSSRSNARCPGEQDFRSIVSDPI